MNIPMNGKDQKPTAPTGTWMASFLHKHAHTQERVVLWGMLYLCVARIKSRSKLYLMKRQTCISTDGWEEKATVWTRHGHRNRNKNEMWRKSNIFEDWRMKKLEEKSRRRMWKKINSSCQLFYPHLFNECVIWIQNRMFFSLSSFSTFTS